MASSSSSALSVGDKVVVRGRDTGTVRFAGSVAFSAGQWVGVELQEPRGTNDGSHAGKRYFSCAPGYGVLVRSSALSLFDPKMLAATRVQALFRGVRERRNFALAQRFRTWDELDMRDESDFLTKNKELGLVQSNFEKIQPKQPGQLKRQLTVERLRNESRQMDRMVSSMEHMTVENDYKGPVISFPVSEGEAERYFEHCVRQPKVLLHRKFVTRILLEVIEHLKRSVSSAVVDLTVSTLSPNENVKNHDESVSRLIICGDTHGQLEDVTWIFQVHGPPSARNMYLFNGDIADRGEYAVEIFVLLFLYMLSSPTSVYINRGNHENSRMNIRDRFEGGGFAKEVRTKYGGDVYKLFKQIFYLLPIAYVINQKIIVVHGGLPRKYEVTLQQIRNINRHRECPEVATTYEDTLFLDLLWSDPRPEQGLGPQPARGEGCVRFGPDVTRRFLEKNKLQLCIRSHEVPSDLRGFKMHHGGKLLTIFSASNYCGVTGNRGGIMIIYPDMHYKIFEHAAPPLQEQQEALLRLTGKSSSLGMSSSSGGSLGSGLGATLQSIVDKKYINDPLLLEQSSLSKKEQFVRNMDRDILDKVMKRICEKKSDLWWYYAHEDVQKSGLIHISKWREGLSAVLELYSVPWTVYQRQLVDVDGNGFVNYREFLDRFRLKLDDRHQRWQQEVVSTIYKALIDEDLSLHDTLALFDKDKNGKISFDEFKQVLNSFDIGLSEPQIIELMRAFDHSEEHIDIAKFFERINDLMRFTLSGQTDSALREKNPSYDHDAAQHVHEILKMLSVQIFSRSESILEIFQSCDIDHNGYLSYDEFVRAMRSLLNSSNSPMLSDTNLQEQLMEVAQYVDLNKNGTINYFEFCNAVIAARSSFPLDNVIQHICGIIYQNRLSLRHIFETCDTELDGSVTPGEFQAALEALNSMLANPLPPLSEVQIEQLVSCVARDACGKIGYDEFLDSFRVVDTKSIIPVHAQ